MHDPRLSLSFLCAIALVSSVFSGFIISICEDKNNSKKKKFYLSFLAICFLFFMWRNGTIENLRYELDSMYSKLIQYNIRYDFQYIEGEI